MHLLTITMNVHQDEEAHELFTQLHNRFHTGQGAGKAVRFTEEADPSGLQHWTLESADSSFTLTHDAPVVYKQAAGVLADFVLQHWESRLIRTILSQDFDFYEEHELQRIVQYCNQIMEEPEELVDLENFVSQRAKWRMKTEEAITAYWSEHSALHVEGFIRFRMKFYWDELREIVEYAVDEYMMDKQYQEFITLLKYFVCVQEAKIPVVHLIHKGEYEFQLLDQEGRLIETNAVESFVMETIDQDVNYEDMIVSTLITVSPGTIHLHSQEPGTQVIKTIQQIFEERVVLCTYCTLCSTLLHRHGESTNQLRHP